MAAAAASRSPDQPVVALTQGDPAGIGPEILVKLLASEVAEAPYRPLLIAERAALESVESQVSPSLRDRFVFFDEAPTRDDIVALDQEAIGVLDPVGENRRVHPGEPGARDAAGAMAALDAGIGLARGGEVDALVTCPLSKGTIARHLLPDFRGHTDYLAAACGLTRYGRDYLMAFLAPDLQVALLTTHLPLRQALGELTQERLLEGLECLQRHAGGRIAVAGLNPHAGEGGLMGSEDEEILRPAVEEARRRGIPAYGPESADALFARSRRGEFDWVLSLYHDQGLIAVKTCSFGLATNWTLGLPFLRTSVDHGTAFEIAGHGRADAGPLAQVVETTLALLTAQLPRCTDRL